MITKEISISRLHELFELDSLTGHLFRRTDWVCGAGMVKVFGKTGMRVGSVEKQGYRVVMVDGSYFKEHRIIWAMLHGNWPEQCIDHINGIKDDNRPCNLRAATYQQNVVHRGPNKNNGLGIKGVHERNGRFRAMIRLDGKLKHLGTFDDAETAHYAYLSHALLAHGEFARVSQ